MTTVDKELSVKELMNLNQELFYFLKESLPVSVKYRFTTIRKQVTSLLTQINEIHIDLIKKYGGVESTPGTWKIDVKIKKEDSEEFVDNPQYEPYKEEYDSFLKEVHKITYTPVLFKDVAKLVTDKDYDLVYLFMTDFE